VTPDGRYLVFQSTQQLTGYDNSAMGSFQLAEGGSEVYVYDADKNRL
jgi:hypothetical protein